ALALLLLAAPAQAATQTFNDFLAGIRAEAVAAGIRPATIDQAFYGLLPSEEVLRLDKKQPESTITFVQYRARILSDTRIAKGREMLQKHAAILNEVSQKFGVQPRYIVALWG